MTKRKITWGDVFLPFILFIMLIYVCQYLIKTQSIIVEETKIIQQDTTQRPDVDTYHMNKTEIE